MTGKGTEISIGKDGFSFKTDGEASERLANAALDFLSPITEGAGLLGTKLRGYRMEAALKATIKAKQLCEEAGLRINPVPPKFLLQWVEGASMEDVETDTALTDLWAHLLVDASQKFSSGHLLYSRILREMTIDEASVLKGMILNANGNYLGDRLGHCEEAVMHWGTLFGSANWFDPGDEVTDEKEVLGAAVRQLERPGTMADGLIFSKQYEDGEEYWEYNNKFLENEKVIKSMNLLVSLNLVRRMEGQGYFGRLNLSMYGSGYSMTPMAAEFCRACGVLDLELEK